MRKTMMVGLVLVLVVAACGGASDANDGDGTTDESPETDELAAPEAPAADDGGDAGDPAVAPSPTTVTAPTELETVPPQAAVEPEVGTTVAPPDVATTLPRVDHPNPLVAAALSDLVNRTSVDPASITVVSAEEVTWSDGSLGCPQPDMSYTQALVNGTRIILRVSGVDYEYHSGGRRAPFYCEDPVAPVVDV